MYHAHLDAGHEWQVIAGHQVEELGDGIEGSTGRSRGLLQVTGDTLIAVGCQGEGDGRLVAPNGRMESTSADDHRPAALQNGKVFEAQVNGVGEGAQLHWDCGGLLQL